MFGNASLAVLANVFGRFRLALLPTEALEAKPLHVVAMRARNEITSLVRRFEFALDARQSLDRRRRDHEDLPAVSECPRPRFGQGDGIAFAFDIARIRIHFVEEEPARRHRAKA